MNLHNFCFHYFIDNCNYTRIPSHIYIIILVYLIVAIADFVDGVDKLFKSKLI